MNRIRRRSVDELDRPQQEQQQCTVQHPLKLTLPELECAACHALAIYGDLDVYVGEWGAWVCMWVRGDLCVGGGEWGAWVCTWVSGGPGCVRG